MPPKGRYTKRSPGTRYTKAMKDVAASKIQGMVRKAIASNNQKLLEVKKSVFTSTDGNQIEHNNFITLDNNLLSTGQGTANPDNSIFNNRIGDKITLRGSKLALFVQLNERFSDVTFRLLVVKCPKGDTPTKATLFNNISGNKMLDTLNTDRYTIISQKFFKIKAPNIASNGVSSGGLLTGSGLVDMLNGQQTVLSPASKIIKIWIPGKAFSKNGIIQYENGSAQVKFFDYRVVIYAYSAYATSETLGFNVGRVNDYINTLYFTDA